jgi:hypothetical protein
MLDTLSLIGDRIIAYRPILRAMGISSTVNGTLLASQLLYLYQQAGRQPFAVTDLELASQTGLRVNEIRHARADLVTRLGKESFFGYHLKGMPRQGWYDVDADRINAITTQRQCLDPNQNPANPSNGQFVLEHEQVRATAPASACHSTNKFVPRGETSISKNLLEEIKPEEDPLKGPLPQPARSVSREDGTNPRALGVSDRDLGLNPRAKPEPKPKDPFASKKLPLDRIPSDLLNCQDLLPEFWAGKKGARSERVFNRVCAKLRPCSPEVRHEALSTAIASKWGDVFPRPQPALGSANGSSRRTSTTITHDSRLQVGEFLRANGLA